MSKSKRSTARLEEWRVHVVSQAVADVFKPGLKNPVLITGYIHDDIRERWPDGTWIHTSLVLDYNEDKREGDTVQTLNSVYTLGSPYKAGGAE